MHFQSTNIVALGFALCAPANAFFRLPCSQPIVSERADPIVDPGVVSGHVHTIMGGNGFGFDMTYADTQASTCSSCAVTKDLSNYWVPTLYYKGQDGTFQSVNQSGGALIYYLQRSDPNDPLASEGLLAFPEGFRMTAGNPFLRNYTDTTAQQAISYACLGTTTAETNGFPNINCPDNLRAQVFFPSCWNGVDLDSPDHQSHMAYPSVYNAGQCPESHPHRFISIFYEVQWETNAFADMWYGDEQPFVWSFGDDTGYGYHGDFINGWDVPTLQDAVTNCNDLSGVITDCPVFDNLYFTADQNDGCMIPPTIDEQVTGTLSALPGCNPVQSGPEMAVQKTGCGAVDVIGAPENPFVDLTSKGFKYLGCGTDVAFGADRTLAAASVTLSNLTAASCVEYCEGNGYSMAGTEYSDQCYCANTMTSGRAPVTGLEGACDMPCSGNATENCGGAGWISLYQKCVSGEDCENISYILNNAVGAQPSAAIPTVSGAVAPTLGSSAVDAVSASATSAAPSSIAVITHQVAPTLASSPADSGATTLSTETVASTSVATVFLTSTTHVNPATPSSTDGIKAISPVSDSCEGNAPTVTVTVALSTVTIEVDPTNAGSGTGAVSTFAVSSKPSATAPFPVPGGNGTVAASGSATGSLKGFPTGEGRIRSGSGHEGHLRRHAHARR